MGTNSTGSGVMENKRTLEKSPNLENAMETNDLIFQVKQPRTLAWLCGCGRGKLISRFSYLETHHLFYSRRILFSSQSIPNVNRGILETEVFPPNEPRKFSASKTVLSARLLLQLVTRTYSSFEKSCCYLCKHAEGHHNHLEKEQWTGRVLELEALG